MAVLFLSGGGKPLRSALGGGHPLFQYIAYNAVKTANILQIIGGNALRQAGVQRGTGMLPYGGKVSCCPVFG